MAQDRIAPSQQISEDSRNPGAQLGQIQTVAYDDRRASLILRGEFDLSNADLVCDTVAEHLARGRTAIRLDLRAVEFVDSTALQVLVHASMQCQRSHGSLTLSHVPARVRRVIDIAGLDTVLLIHPSQPAPAPPPGPA
jgi:anti-sigma B factor antagonist